MVGKKEILSQKFMNFAQFECRGSSPLYEHLSLYIAESDDLLKLSSYARDGQPIPNLLFAAVHFLLLKGKKGELKQYYPSLVNNPKPHDESFHAFEQFCQDNQETIIQILQNKRVQTNEVRRCAYLYPVFSSIYEMAKKPLALIEIGTSAGLQLLWDKYSYSYGTTNTKGNLRSDVHISSEIRGINSPLFLTPTPTVTKRIGIDLNIIDLRERDDFLWLKALIWPEHKERTHLFEKAVQCLQKNPIELIEGNGISLLKEIAQGISKDDVLCVFHTHVANQMTVSDKKQLVHTIELLGRERDVVHLYNNMEDGDLHLDSYVGGRVERQTVARTEGHGKWFEWLL